MIRVIMLVFILSSCTNGGNSLDKNQSIGYGYRLFKNTPVWELAQSVAKSDTIAIEGFLKNHKQLVDYRDPILGQTLLWDAVFNRNYASVITLLKLGADPNKQSLEINRSPLMVAASLGGEEKLHPIVDSRFLKLLLKYGGNPNDVQDGDSMPKRGQNYATPLAFACLSSIPEYVRILVDSGANINFVSKDVSTTLFAAVVGNNPQIVLYLLKHGADYRRPLLSTADGKKNEYILDVINQMWHFDKDSKEFKEESLIKEFIKAKS